MVLSIIITLAALRALAEGEITEQLHADKLEVAAAHGRELPGLKWHFGEEASEQRRRHCECPQCVWINSSEQICPTGPMNHEVGFRFSRLVSP